MNIVVYLQEEKLFYVHVYGLLQEGKLFYHMVYLHEMKCILYG
jgi:hypothetical protein